MTEEAQLPQQPSINVLTQFIRDMSFENILARNGDVCGTSPEVKINVNLEALNRSTLQHYEIIVKLDITSKSKENGNTLFLLELEYGGVFKISGVPEEQLHPFLFIECPRILFPFLRRIVSDITRDGGFPALNLENIDFLHLYKNEATRRKATKNDGKLGDKKPNMMN